MRRSAAYCNDATTKWWESVDVAVSNVCIHTTYRVYCGLKLWQDVLSEPCL